MSFKKFVHYMYIIKFIVIMVNKSLIVCLTIAVYVCRICSDVPLSFWILVIVTALFFPWSVWLRLFNCYFAQKTSFWFCWFSSTIFLFPSSLISVLTFIVSFLLLTLDLLRSSFFKALRGGSLDYCFENFFFTNRYN